ncbi:Restriction endonuclease [Nitrosomonas sp. Nm58]|nr:Restriction endonuclease [Nitrosomonas sp. Nm58]
MHGPWSKNTMPKRTNDFQSLIKTIYEQIVHDFGGKVTESSMVFDKEAEILREVDILVEYKYAGHDFSFVVECRDRSRSETVEWIDGLVGKTKSLNVNKVIAVSSKGFASSAKRKAQKNGIETLTLEKAEEIDWVKYPIKPGVIVITDDIYQIHDVLYKDGESFVPVTTLGLESNVEVNGEIVGDFKSLIEYFFQENIVPCINEYKKSHFLEIFKTRADVEKILLVESEYSWPGIFVLDADGSRKELTKIKYVITGVRKSMNVEQTHHVFNEKMVSTGRHFDADGSVIDFNVVQDPDTKKIHARWARRKESTDNA